MRVEIWTVSGTELLGCASARMQNGDAGEDYLLRHGTEMMRGQRKGGEEEG